MISAVNQSTAAFQRCWPRKFDNAESHPTKVSWQKKSADFMSDDRFLSPIKINFLVRVTSALGRILADLG